MEMEFILLNFADATRCPIKPINNKNKNQKMCIERTMRPGWTNEHRIYERSFNNITNITIDMVYVCMNLNFIIYIWEISNEQLRSFNFCLEKKPPQQQQYKILKITHTRTTPTTIIQNKRCSFVNLPQKKNYNANTY